VVEYPIELLIGLFIIIKQIKNETRYELSYCTYLDIHKFHIYYIFIIVCATHELAYDTTNLFVFDII
jgi:hypothetical protein